MQCLSQEIALMLFKEQRHFFHPSKHLHELQGETGRAYIFLIAERLSSPGQNLSVFADSCQSLFFMLSNRVEIEGWRVNCGYVSMCLGNKSVNCSTCTMLVVKKGLWNFISFFLFPLVFCTVDCPSHLNLLIPLIQQEFFLMVLCCLKIN